MSKIQNSVLLIFLFLMPNLVFPKTIVVGKGEQINSIKQALAVCENGDIIRITKGFYAENNLLITKQISLLGIDFPTISGNKKERILTIKANNVTVSGIHFADTGASFVKDNSAVKLDSVTNCVIKDNKLSNNFFGIYLGKSQNCIVSNNEIVSSQKAQTYSGNGIHLWNCKDIKVVGNIVDGHRDGIYLEFVRRSLIKDNLSKRNLRYGLHFMFSDSCEYSHNIFQHNTAGVAVMFTHHVQMNNNLFINNWGDASFGLLLKEISDGEIYNNKFIRNTCGIYLEGSNRNIIERNLFENNGWAIRLMANSMDNKFSKNNFLGNSFEVTTNNTRNFNTFSNNYWSDYQGYDLNKDGIGEIPHHPVKLFSMLVEKNRPTIILLRSFFVELLNTAEKVFPVLTPETLVDKYPEMSFIK
ncbi:MAG: nitrous oxide reductase family maturation protein NosD [Melioribacteraceae bacterium]